jgi:hypothetical protein
MRDLHSYKSSTCMIGPFKPPGLSPQAAKHCKQVTHIQTPEQDRNKGQATALLKQIGLMADLNNWALVLKPESYADSPLDDQSLIAWYLRNGFAELQPAPELLLFRAPKRRINGAI